MVSRRWVARPGAHQRVSAASCVCGHPQGGPGEPAGAVPSERIASGAGAVLRGVAPGTAGCVETGCGPQPAGLGRGRWFRRHPALPSARGFALLGVAVQVCGLSAASSGWPSSGSGQALLWSWVAHVFSRLKDTPGTNSRSCTRGSAPALVASRAPLSGSALQEANPGSSEGCSSWAWLPTNTPLSNGHPALCAPREQLLPAVPKPPTALMGPYRLVAPVPAHPVLPEQTLPAAKGSKKPTPPLWLSSELAGGTGISCPLLVIACPLLALSEQFVASP